MRESIFLFAYGSIDCGMVHHHKIENFIVSVKEAFIHASVFRSSHGFPLLLKGGQDQVPGHVCELKLPDLMQKTLDEFYGVDHSDPFKCQHIRGTAVAKFPIPNSESNTQSSASRPNGQEANGQEAEVIAYYINPLKLPSSAKPIEGGDWLESIKQQPPLSETLSSRQRKYIQKLGASGARDIVPIDMELYRELMNMELIVDKGRRLALSKLGQDVYKYL